ncbi:hypothetical protein GF374_00440 [Candidatus Woesearchaeota archaeon]|nr:hypothetical protein [Candidatus Woesearchaeota archaeon]
MADELNLDKIKKELKAIEKLEEKEKYLEKILSEIKDENLAKKVEKLLSKIKKLIKVKRETESDLEKRFTIKIPTSKLLDINIESDIKDSTEAIAPITKTETTEDRSILNTYQNSSYEINTSYLTKEKRETVHNVVEDYLRGDIPENPRKAYELRNTITEKLYEGGVGDFDTLQEQVDYELEKAAHPERDWYRNREGQIKYKTIKGVKTKTALEDEEEDDEKYKTK